MTPFIIACFDSIGVDSGALSRKSGGSLPFAADRDGRPWRRRRRGPSSGDRMGREEWLDPAGENSRLLGERRSAAHGATQFGGDCLLHDASDSTGNRSIRRTVKVESFNQTELIQIISERLGVSEVK